MKINTALLTTAARQAAARTVLDYQAGVYEHVGGGWEQHSQARMYEFPYEVTTATTQSDGVVVTVYNTFTDTGTDITVSGAVGSFTWPTANSTTYYGDNWHPYALSKFAAVISGNVSVATTGDYIFTLASADASYLYVDNVLKINNGGTHKSKTVTATIHLTAGVHAIRVSYAESSGGPSLVNLTVPVGVVYAAVITTTKALGGHTLRMLMDYSNAGVVSTQAFAIPISRTTNTYGPTAAPIIVTQPLTRTVAAGTSVTFAVVAISSYALTYQWFFNGVLIKNAINSSYTVDSATFATAGDYYVVVTNVVGSSTSNLASLIIET